MGCKKSLVFAACILLAIAIFGFALSNASLIQDSRILLDKIILTNIAVAKLDDILTYDRANSIKQEVLLKPSKDCNTETSSINEAPKMQKSAEERMLEQLADTAETKGTYYIGCGAGEVLLD